MDNKRSAVRKLSIYKENSPKRELSPANEATKLISLDETPPPMTVPCKIQIASELLNNIAEDYRLLRKLFQVLIESEMNVMKGHEKEVDALKSRYMDLKMKEAEIKRTRWCHQCDMQATFLSSHGMFFYCSVKCEQEHQAPIL